MRPGVNALRSPVYPEMINIVNNKPVLFTEYKFDKDAIRNAFENYEFTNGRPITKSILAWWLYTRKDQELISNENSFEIEHIYSKKRQDNDKGLKNTNNLESLGNKALLEKNINIRASDYRFEDKKKYYSGFTTDKGIKKVPTKDAELFAMATELSDFEEKDIIERKELIISSFINYLKENDLIN